MTKNPSKQNKSNNKNSHDVFVKKAMSDKNVAREFFEVNLPQDILSQVDLSTLKQEKENYFDNTLGHGIVDILYSVNFGEDKGYIMLLVEHQTTQDYKMPLRIMKYVRHEVVNKSCGTLKMPPSMLLDEPTILNKERMGQCSKA